MKDSNLTEEGVETREKAYSLKEFLDDCKNHQKKIEIDLDAQDDAKNSPLHLNGEKEILDFLSQHKESDFNYKNTKRFRKGIQGQHPPVDAYIINLKSWDLYIAFCIVQTKKGWYIKSFHSDNTGETLSIGELVFAKFLEKK